MVKVPPNDARSVAVPIVPKRTGEIFLEVSSIFEVKDYTTYLSSARDTVIKKLFVVVRTFDFFFRVIDNSS